MEVNTVEVTLEGYGGWLWPLVIAGGIFAAWLAFFLLMRLVPGTEWHPGPTVKLPWIIRWFSYVPMFIAVMAIIIVTQGASNAWDEQQRIEALVEAGIENPRIVEDADGYKVNDWAGTQDGQYLLGYFQQLEGEKWLLVGGKV